MAVIRTREPIYVALWNLLIQTTEQAGLPPWVMSSRYARHFDDVDVTQMPALFMVESGEGWSKAGKGVPAERVLKCHLLMYCSSAAPDALLPATLINDFLDVLDTIVEQPGVPSNAQTLGGLVDHVYITGEIEIAEAYLQEKSIVVIPLEIMIP
jgi:hypothetical protein